MLHFFQWRGLIFSEERPFSPSNKSSFFTIKKRVLFTEERVIFAEKKTSSGKLVVFHRKVGFSLTRRELVPPLFLREKLAFEKYFFTEERVISAEKSFLGKIWVFHKELDSFF